MFNAGSEGATCDSVRNSALSWSARGGGARMDNTSGSGRRDTVRQLSPHMYLARDDV